MNLAPATPPTWDPIYQLEVTDPVLAGPGGVANRQAQQLLNRTEWLKAQLASLEADVLTLQESGSDWTSQISQLQTGLNAKQNALSLGALTLTLDPFNIDFNAFTTPGWLRLIPSPEDLEFWNQTSGFPNWPNGPQATAGGILEVMVAGGMVVQVYFSPFNGTVSRRWRADGVWSAWAWL